MKTRDENNFDGLRLLAATLVIFSHCYPLGNHAPEYVSHLIRQDTGGGIAVSVFFIISGYLIAGSYAVNPHILPYLAKRILRIFPAFIVSILFCALVLGPAFTTLPLGEYFHHEKFKLFLGSIRLYPYYTYLPGVFETNPSPGMINGTIWTLPMEFTMYVAVLAVACTAGLRPWLLAALSAACFYWHFRTTQQDLPLFYMQPFFFSRNAALFLAGSLLYAVRESWFKKPLIAWVLAIIMVANLHMKWGYWTLYLLLPYVTIAFALRPLPILKDAGRFGDFSYGLYLYGFPVQQLMVYLTHNQISLEMLFVSSMLGAGCLAAISWYFIEAPALKLKHHMKPMREFRISRPSPPKAP